MITAADLSQSDRALALGLIAGIRTDDRSVDPDARLIRAVTESSAIRAAAVAAWIARTLAGRFGQSPSDTTDDPAGADVILFEALGAVFAVDDDEVHDGTGIWQDRAQKAIRLAAVAIDDMAEAAQLAGTWDAENHHVPVGMWQVTEELMLLARWLSDLESLRPGCMVGDTLSRDRALDVLAAELMAVDFTNHQPQGES
jgi:hypothetical protein